MQVGGIANNVSTYTQSFDKKLPYVSSETKYYNAMDASPYTSKITFRYIVNMTVI